MQSFYLLNFLSFQNEFLHRKSLLLQIGKFQELESQVERKRITTYKAFQKLIPKFYQECPTLHYTLDCTRLEGKGIQVFGILHNDVLFVNDKRY